MVEIKKNVKSLLIPFRRLRKRRESLYGKFPDRTGTSSCIRSGDWNQSIDQLANDPSESHLNQRR